MVYAQLGQQPLVRTTATSPEPRPGTLSCLSARPPDLAFVDGDTAPGGGRVPEHCPVSILQAHGGDAIPRLAYRKANVLWPLRLYQPWTYPRAGVGLFSNKL